MPQSKISVDNESTPLELLQRAFDLSDVQYTLRVEPDGWAYLFVGDDLLSAVEQVGYPADQVPLEVLKSDQLNLSMFEFLNGEIVSC